jgi:hypothetical protein
VVDTKAGVANCYVRGSCTVLVASAVNDNASATLTNWISMPDESTTSRNMYRVSGSWQVASTLLICCQYFVLCSINIGTMLQII